MKKEITYLLLTVSLICFSCNIAGRENAISFYHKNNLLLSKIVEQMMHKRFYTEIRIVKNSMIRKIFSFDFSSDTRVIIGTIDSNYHKIFVSKVVEKNNFSDAANVYFTKTNTMFTETDLETTNAILEFMYANDIENIVMKTPEMSDMDIPLSIFGGLQYRTRVNAPPDVSRSEQIDGNWYYVTYK